MSSNPPIKHHFIAQFLLDAWTGADGKLWRFTNPWQDKIAAKYVAPAELGYQEGLYTIPGVAPEQAQQIEEVSMSRLDDLAAAAHRMLLAGDIAGMGSRYRSAWSRFMMSLWFRTPDGVRGLKDATAALLKVDDGQLAAAYRARRQPDYPPTWVEAIAAFGPELADQAALKVLHRQIDNPKFGQRLNDMHWIVRDIDGPRDLMISDAVLAQTGALFGPSGYLIMPISPRRLFFAAQDFGRVEAFMELSPRTVMSLANHAVVRRAREFVGATTRDELAYVQEHFASALKPGLAQSLADQYRRAAA